MEPIDSMIRATFDLIDLAIAYWLLDDEEMMDLAFLLAGAIESETTDA